MNSVLGEAGGLRTRLVGLALLFGGLLPGCSEAKRVTAVTGAVGVFYGGEVQELSRVELGAVSPKTVGFRLLFPPGSSDRTGKRQVVWQVVRPGPAGRRVTMTEELKLDANRERLDQVIELPLSGRMGTINVRVVVDGVLAIDRAILLRKKR